MYLLIGSLSANQAARDISGTVVSLKLLLDSLSALGIAYHFIDTGEIRRCRYPFTGYIRVARQVFRKTKHAEAVCMHLSPHGFLYLAPVILGAKIIYRKPLVLRLFGGLSLTELSGLRSRLAVFFARRMDAVLLQSKTLVEEGKTLGFKNVTWFPTSRKLPGPEEPNPWHGENGDYVFIAQIKIKKGIFEVIEAARQLPDLTFSVYGPFYDNLDPSIFAGIRNLTYRGVLKPEEVPGVLQKARALVFPTYLDEEGYSGIIIEAFGAGCPIICTRWKFLPEIVDESCAVLCRPKNASSLVSAIKIHWCMKNQWSALSEGCYGKRLEFSCEVQAKNHTSICSELI